VPFIVTANDVTHGKPHPEPYLKGMEGERPFPFSPTAMAPADDGTDSTVAEARKMVGVAFEPSDVLVVEDAPSGLKAGLAAGCKTLGVGTGQPLERFRTFEATVKALDLTRFVLSSLSLSPENISG
jgi:beta-phosphoglucomutase-like phosphatase (HAD superfamily)